MFKQDIMESIIGFIKKNLPNGGTICVTGCGRAGKTTLANDIVLGFGKNESGRYPFDCLHTPIEYRRKIMESRGIVITGSHPDTVIKEMALKTIKSIKNGEDVPIYESVLVGNDVEYKTIGMYRNKKYNIIDGLTAMHHSVGKLYDIVIFMECDEKTELQRRLLKEGYERNQNPEEIMKVFPLRRKQYEEYVLVYKNDATIVINTTDGNNISITFNKTP
ncbi:hypothetical protein J4231_00565 [Candidatus Woesearchaeota archaeon]|nr:hypothetical protein [Candidatus Woesearchaeota archaeon]